MFNYLRKTRKELFESLQFSDFISKMFKTLVPEYGNSDNSLILDFLRVLGHFYSSSLMEIKDYRQALKDSVFWESREFYRELMNKFVTEKLNSEEFAKTFFGRLWSDREKAESLYEDFSKQANIKLDPQSFQFSNIICSFEFPLSAYLDELAISEYLEDEPDFTSIDDPDSLRKIVQEALLEVNKYFTD